MQRSAQHDLRKSPSLKRDLNPIGALIDAHQSIESWTLSTGGNTGDKEKLLITKSVHRSSKHNRPAKGNHKHGKRTRKVPHKDGDDVSSNIYKRGKRSTKSKNEKKSKHMRIDKRMAGLEEVNVATSRALHDDWLLSPRVVDAPLLSYIEPTETIKYRSDKRGQWYETQRQKMNSSNIVRGGDDSNRIMTRESDNVVPFSPFISEVMVCEERSTLLAKNSPPISATYTPFGDQKNALAIENKLNRGDEDHIDFASWERRFSLDTKSKSSISKESWVASWEGKFSSSGTEGEKSWVASFGETKQSEDGPHNVVSFDRSYDEISNRVLQFTTDTMSIVQEASIDFEQHDLLDEGSEIGAIQEMDLAEKFATQPPTSSTPGSDAMGGLTLVDSPSFTLTAQIRSVDNISVSSNQRRRFSLLLDAPLSPNISGQRNPHDRGLTLESNHTSIAAIMMGGAIEEGHEKDVKSANDSKQPSIVQNDGSVRLSQFQRKTRDSWKVLTRRRLCLLLLFLLWFGMLGAAGLITFFLLSDSSQSNELLAPSISPSFLLDTILTAAQTISGEEPFAVAGSPQLEAVDWMSSVDNFFFHEDSDEWKERYCLVVLFFSTRGREWSITDRWLDPNLHHCDWSGAIACQLQPTRHRLAQSMDMTMFGLKGVIPYEFVVLTTLTSLLLSRNELTGKLPSVLFHLSNLALLELHANAITGTLPLSVIHTSSLCHLDLSNNKLTGSLPTAFYDLSGLQTVDLSGNLLRGTISSDIYHFELLTSLNFRNNRFSGTIPAVFDKFPKLDHILLDHNQFTGTLGPWTNHFFQRRDIGISNNFLTGTIPGYFEGTFSNITFNLRTVDVSNNKLNGTIPTLMSLVPSLVSLNISGNQLTGTFPNPFLGWPTLEVVAGANNRFTGALPSGFDPAHMRVMDFSGNGLQGSIPSLLYNLTRLEHLVLSHNALEGSLTSFIGQLTFLRSLEAQDCSLTGSLPTEIGLLTTVKVIDLGSNHLEGSLPTELGSLQMLQRLILNSNQFTSTIPWQLSLLSGLLEIDLSKNSFSGALPSFLGTLVNLEQFTIKGNPLLTGTVPVRLCAILGGLSIENIGCRIECHCCLNEMTYCGKAMIDNVMAHNNNI